MKITLKAEAKIETRFINTPAQGAPIKCTPLIKKSCDKKDGKMTTNKTTIHP